MDPMNASASPALALLNARLLDPATGEITAGGVFVENGIIVDAGAKVTQANVGAATVPACGVTALFGMLGASRRRSRA